MHFAITVLILTGIAGLFYLDRDPAIRPSMAVWIPTAWMLIVSSRQVSDWLSLNHGAPLVSRFTQGHLSDAAFFSFLILLGLLVLNYRSRQVVATLRRNLPLIVYLTYCALSLLWSDFPVVGFKRWIKALGSIVMALVILTDRDPESAIRRFFSRVSFLLLPLSVLFIEVYPSLGTGWDPSGHVIYYFGVMTQKNELGVVSMLCGLASLSAILSTLDQRHMPHRSRHFAAHGTVLLMTFWLLYRSDSMTSMASLIIACGVMVLAGRPWAAGRRAYLYSIAGGAFVLAVFATFIDESGILLRMIGRNATLTGRTDIWKAVLSFHTNPLVGTGFDSFWLGDRIQTVWRMIGYTGVAEAHDGYLEIYINLGWIGLVLLIWIILRGYRNIIALHCRDHRAGSARLAFLTAGLMYSLTEAGFRAETPMWLAILLAITALAPAYEIAAVEPASHPAPSQFVRPLGRRIL